MHAYLFLYHFNAAKRKREDDTFHFLAELEEAAEHRQAEADSKHLKLMIDLQNQSRQHELEHEQKMMSMMMSMMQQTMSMGAPASIAPQSSVADPGSSLRFPLPSSSAGGMYPP